MASSRTDHVLLVLLGLLGSAGVLAENLPAPAAMTEDEVPLYSPQDAWRLAHQPESRMVDDTTCERVEGTFRWDEHGNRQVVANGRAALFRKRNQRRPFMRVETRSDGVFVARFPAQPNDVIYARSYAVNPRTREYIYGEATASVCRKGAVSVGDVESVVEEPPEGVDESTGIPW